MHASGAAPAMIAVPTTVRRRAFLAETSVPPASNTQSSSEPAPALAPFTLPTDRRLISYTNPTFASSSLEPVLEVRYTLDGYDQRWLQAFNHSNFGAAMNGSGGGRTTGMTQLSVQDVELYITALEIARAYNPDLNTTRLEPIARSMLPPTSDLNGAAGHGNLAVQTATLCREAIRDYWTAKRQAMGITNIGVGVEGGAVSFSKGGGTSAPASASGGSTQRDRPLLAELVSMPLEAECRGIDDDTPFFNREVEGGSDISRQRAHEYPSAEIEQQEAQGVSLVVSTVTSKLATTMFQREVLKLHTDVMSVYELAWARALMAGQAAAPAGGSQVVEDVGLVTAMMRLGERKGEGGGGASQGAYAAELKAVLGSPMEGDAEERLRSWGSLLRCNSGATPS